MNSNNNCLLWTDVGPFIIDCGSTFPYELRELGVPPESFKGIVITHVSRLIYLKIHGDHINGVYTICYLRWNSKTSKGLKTTIYAVEDVFDRLRPILKTLFIDLVYDEVVEEVILKEGTKENLGKTEIIP